MRTPQPTRSQHGGATVPDSVIDDEPLTTNHRPFLLAALLYAAIACMLTWPQARRVHNALPTGEDGIFYEDPFLNSWILAWGARAAVTQPLHIFDANAFWPRTNTLAYSDHMLGYLPLTLPLFWLSRNAILVHNVILLLTFVTAAFGAFVLVRDVTGATGPALLAGVAYGFCPFRFEEYGHVQVLSSQWMPLALWCLHRVHARLEAGGAFPWRWYAGAVGFGALESLCSTYYSIYFPVFIACFAAASCMLAGGKRRWRRMAWTLAAPVIWTALVSPTLAPYLRLRAEMGFVRDLRQNVEYSATLGSFLAATPGNAIYGAATARFHGPEAAAFPGAVVYALTAGALVWLLSRRAWRADADRASRWGWVYLLCGVVSAALAMGPYLQWRGRELCWGPYMLLYRYAPGFDGLRAPCRFVGLVMLCFAVLSGVGAQRLVAWFESARLRRVTLAGLIGLLVCEYAAFPLRLARVPVGDEIPALYRWLAAQRPTKRIVELPLDLGLADMQRMYFSTYHWHKLVNGKSGFLPPESTAKFLSFVVPRPELVSLMADMQLDYVITDDALLEGLGATYGAIPCFRLVKQFGAKRVWQLRREVVRRPPAVVDARRLAKLPRNRWRPVANVADARARLVQDGDPATVWQTPSDQEAGMIFGIVLDRPRPVRVVRMGFGIYGEEIPRYLVARVSPDGKHWTTAQRGNRWPDMFARIYRSALERPRNPECDIYLPRGEWRFIELRLIKRAYAGWAIAELDVFEQAAKSAR